jgi:periplasmic copper chaperone A
MPLTTLRRAVRRTATAVLAAGAGLLLLPVAADAHVTIQPAEAEAGSFSVSAFRVPNEREDTSTVKLRVILPEDQPVSSVSTTPVPGWTATTKTRTLDEPLDQNGRQVTDVVSEITWTADGDGIRPGEFEDFEISMGPLPQSGEMVFKALQTYSDGEQVNWNEVAVDDTVEPEHPAPVLTLTAGDQPVDTEPAAADPPRGDEATPAVSDDSDTLPLVLSGAALVAALAALVVAWRRGRP